MHSVAYLQTPTQTHNKRLPHNDHQGVRNLHSDGMLGLPLALTTGAIFCHLGSGWMRNNANGKWVKSNTSASIEKLRTPKLFQCDCSCSWRFILLHFFAGHKINQQHERQVGTDVTELDPDIDESSLVVSRIMWEKRSDLLALTPIWTCAKRPHKEAVADADVRLL